MMLRVLDLFSGIGGFSLGLERTGGFRTVAFCEIDRYAQCVLKRHWPEVPIYDDIRTLTADRLTADGIAVDVICGGFPCQDISVFGKGAGIDGSRSRLWREAIRLTAEIRPRLIIMENVSMLLSRGMDRLLWALAEIGYDAEWHCIPASAVGAPHRRDRIWIIAYFQNALRDRCRLRPPALTKERWDKACLQSNSTNWWSAEPAVGRMAYGVSHQVDRVRCLGNAVVPQIVEAIGYAILEWQAEIS